MTALPRTTAEACIQALHAVWGATDELGDHHVSDPLWDKARRLRRVVNEHDPDASYIAISEEMAEVSLRVLTGLTELYAALGHEPQSCAWNTHRQVVQAALEEVPLTSAERVEQAEELRGDGEREEAA